jgi:hypothetical protein
MTSYDVAGRIEFGNVVGVEQFSMTRSRGVRPSTIQFVVPVVPEVPIGVSSPLSLHDGVNSFTLRDCLVQSVDIDYSMGDRYIVTLLDERWKWSYGEISGEYNIVRGGVILHSTRKKPGDLAKLLFEAMGVDDYDITQLPNDTYPEITWDLEVPAIALESLASSLGCIICLQLDGKVKICKIGVGAKLPVIRGSEMRESLKFVEAPDDIYISANATVWEISLKIDKPFGKERDKGSTGTSPVESIIPIDKLSYKPKSGWGNEDPTVFPNVGNTITPGNTIQESIKERDRIRGLAQESIWKIFGFKFPFNLPGLAFQIKDVNQLIFHDELLSQSLVQYSSPLQKQAYEQRRMQPFVYGVYYDRKETGKNNVDAFSHEWKKNQKLVYPGSFNVDKDRGVISFSDAVYQYDSDPSAKERFKAPELYLRVAVSVKDPETGRYWREAMRNKTGYRNATKPLWVKRSDLRREIMVDPTTSKAFASNGDNLKTVESELRKYSLIELKKLESIMPAQASYSGFVPIDLDGTIEQVTYEISSSGETTTTASYGYEHSLIVPSFEERRRIALLNQFADKQSNMMNGNKVVAS